MLRHRAGLLGLAILILATLTVAYVPAGQVAVRETWGGGTTPLGPGLHLRLPLYQRLYRYVTRPVAFNEAVEITTRDSARFRLPITMSVWVSPGDLLTFHRGRSGREPVTYLKERARAAVIDAAKGLNADEILTADLRRRLGPVVSAGLIAQGIAEEDFAAGHPAPPVVLNAVLDYLHRRFPASARRLAEAFLASDPKEPLYLTAMGIVLEAEGKKDQAEKEYLDALYLDPASPEPMSRLYVLYQSSSDANTILRLERLLTASLEKNPNSAMHHDWLGQVYLRTGRYDKAEAAFTAAVGQAPKEAEYRISLGSLRAKQGKYDEARAAYEQALTLHPEHPLALFNLGSTYAQQGQYDKALEYFRRAERAGPPNHALFNALAQVYEEKGQWDHAAEYLRLSLRLRPEQPGRKEELRRAEAKLRKKA
jgi:tetratricopeptide (TPR) repeat protein